MRTHYTLGFVTGLKVIVAKTWSSPSRDSNLVVETGLETNDNISGLSSFTMSDDILKPNQPPHRCIMFLISTRVTNFHRKSN